MVPYHSQAPPAHTALSLVSTRASPPPSGGALAPSLLFLPGLSAGAASGSSSSCWCMAVCCCCSRTRSPLAAGSASGSAQGRRTHNVSEHRACVIKARVAHLQAWQRTDSPCDGAGRRTAHSPARRGAPARPSKHPARALCRPHCVHHVGGEGNLRQHLVFAAHENSCKPRTHRKLPSSSPSMNRRPAPGSTRGALPVSAGALLVPMLSAVNDQYRL